MTVTYEDYLAHYGVKGMKWGKRKKEDNPHKVTFKDRESIRLQDKKGLSKTEADAKAERRAKIRKGALVAGGIALTAVATYVVAKKIDQNFIGVNLPEGAMMQNINNVKDIKSTKEGFLYVTVNKKDHKKYASRYAAELKQRSKTLDQSQDIYKTNLSAITPIKAPSNMQAKKLYKEYVSKYGDFTESKDYNNFNALLNYVGDENDKKQFSDFLRSKGYNAFIDTHDQKNAYNSVKPLVLLDGTTTASIKGHNQVHGVKDYNDYVMRDLAKSTGKLAVGFIALNQGAKAIRRIDTQKQVDKYFKENPKSKKTPAEVYMLIEKGEL